ncbi:unnamed protein product [Haemonchus placei]|uniref:UBX domain-containing protein n=1 Tax=Haemonchus placei TaxID=6290 RepID=A0A0N4W5P9_HAEPC|nr:unnamed protein product [Haemonchus placei]
MAQGFRFKRYDEGREKRTTDAQQSLLGPSVAEASLEERACGRAPLLECLMCSMEKPRRISTQQREIDTCVLLHMSSCCPEEVAEEHNSAEEVAEERNSAFESEDQPWSVTLTPVNEKPITFRIYRGEPIEFKVTYKDKDELYEAVKQKLIEVGAPDGKLYYICYPFDYSLIENADDLRATSHRRVAARNPLPKMANRLEEVAGDTEDVLVASVVVADTAAANPSSTPTNAIQVSHACTNSLPISTTVVEVVAITMGLLLAI